MKKIPFDEQAFLGGAIAINEFGTEIKMLNGLVTYPDGSGNKGLEWWRDIAKEDWTMKPPSPESDGWIPVKGDGTIPAEIVGAKAGEFEYRLRRGDCYKDLQSSHLDWFHVDYCSHVDIVAVRLVKCEPVEINTETDTAKVKPSGTIGIPDIKSDPDLIKRLEDAAIKPKPYRSPSIENALGDFRFDAKIEGPVVECDVLSRLMK